MVAQLNLSLFNISSFLLNYLANTMNKFLVYATVEEHIKTNIEQIKLLKKYRKGISTSKGLKGQSLTLNDRT